LAFEIENDALQIGLIQDLFPLGGPEEERAAAEVVDPTGHALGVLVDAADEAVAEQGTLESSHPQMMLDVSSRLLQVERGKLVADSDTLVEGFVGGETELVGEVGLAKQHQSDRGDRVHPLIEEKAELIKKLAR
jgi:hypothetical protein